MLQKIILLLLCLIVLSSFVTASPEDLTANLVSYWSFDDNNRSGNTIYDNVSGVTC